MALAWFICQYKIVEGNRPGVFNLRICAMNDFTPQIVADGGKWSESEVLGGYAIVKVRASDATLALIANTTGFIRIPNHISLSDVLGDLTSNQRTILLNLITSMGYTPAEISAALGGNLAGWRSRTLGQVLRFVAQRRRKPRWDGSQILLDGIIQPCKSIDRIDIEVQ